MHFRRRTPPPGLAPADCVARSRDRGCPFRLRMRTDPARMRRLPHRSADFRRDRQARGVGRRASGTGRHSDSHCSTGRDEVRLRVCACVRATAEAIRVVSRRRSIRHCTIWSGPADCSATSPYPPRPLSSRVTRVTHAARRWMRWCSASVCVYTAIASAREY